MSALVGETMSLISVRIDSGKAIDDCCWLTDADGYILNNVDGHSIAQSLERVQARLTASDPGRPTVFAINAHMSEDVSRIVDDTVEGLYRQAYRTFHTTFGREARGKLQQPMAEREVVCLTGLAERMLVSAWLRSGDTVLASRVQPLPSTTQQWVPVLPSSARCPGSGPQAQVAHQGIDVVFPWMHEPPEAFLSSVLGFQDWNIYVMEPFVSRPILSTLRLRDVTEEGSSTRRFAVLASSAQMLHSMRTSYRKSVVGPVLDIDRDADAYLLAVVLSCVTAIRDSVCNYRRTSDSRLQEVVGLIDHG
ncbi:hypothetical protein B0A48_08254 [Cryoendolithus antarcticus]|uniref:Uncharacterized protein n=1 Tax=Cryoendolithus antarcticus TaxID=1507870 RepID=A0A1V8T5D7_9PEZI|nr:hypothetical protein B0A48_08254 [Cryoendolithus antarcticus]